MEIHQKIRQSNHLIESPYTQEFTSHEIKLFEIAMSGISNNDIDRAIQQSNKRYSLTSNELATLLNTSVSVVSHEVERTTKRIMKKTIHLRKILEDGTVEFEMINIIPYARYKNGLLEFDLNYGVIPYLVEINKNFTEYQLHYLLSMRSANAIKLYKLLYQYKNIQSRIFVVLELKKQFGLINKYPLYKNFKQKILDPSIKQINEFTDLEVSYKEIKCGRKVEKIEFFFTLKNLSSIKEEPTLIDNKIIKINNNFPDELNQLISDINHKISETTKKCLLKYFHNKGAKYIQASISYANDNAKTNYDKYLKDTLKNEWSQSYLIKLIMQEKTQEKEEMIRQEKLKEEQEKKLKMEAANAKKSIIESEYYKLNDKTQNFYIDLADQIFTKNYEALKVFSNIRDTLPIAIFAESNNKLNDYNPTLSCYLRFHKINLIHE